jgi:hypothetical protein
MASTAYKFQVNTTAASDVNLTSISTNPDLVPVATPREGGFTLRKALLVTVQSKYRLVHMSIRSIYELPVFPVHLR